MTSAQMFVAIKREIPELIIPYPRDKISSNKITKNPDRNN
jgi:hypothetical protein